MTGLPKIYKDPTDSSSSSLSHSAYIQHLPDYQALANRQQANYTLHILSYPFNMSMSSYSSNGSSTSTWQDKLQERCRAAQMNPPVFSIVSDRRGGRTAWSSTVVVSGQSISARYWYDGQYVNNAKEDAAEVALRILASNSPGSNHSRAW